MTRNRKLLLTPFQLWDSNEIKAQNIDITDTSNALMKFLVSHLSAISGGTSGFGGSSSRTKANFARANPPETRN